MTITFVLPVLDPGQQLRDFVLDEVQQLNGVRHPQHQRPQTWDQLLHAEQLELIGLPVTGAADAKRWQSARLNAETSSQKVNV